MDIEMDDSLESDLDLDFCIYMDYQNSTENEKRVSPCMAHDNWLMYYINDRNVDYKIRSKIVSIYKNKDVKIRQNIMDIRDFILLSNKIKKKVMPLFGFLF